MSRPRWRIAIKTESDRTSFFNHPTVHFYRNVFSHVPSTELREIAAMPKATLASEDRAAADEKVGQVVAKLRPQRLAKAAELVEASVHETLTYYAFPALNLATARLRHIAGTTWSTKRYLDMQLLKDTKHEVSATA